MAIYYVDFATGDDNNAGSSEAAPFKTPFQAGCHTVAGDIIYLKNTAPYENGGRHQHIPALTNGQWNAALQYLYFGAGALSAYSHRPGDRIRVKSAGAGNENLYTITAADANGLYFSPSLSAGNLSDIQTVDKAHIEIIEMGSVTQPIIVEGYQTAPGDGGVATFDDLDHAVYSAHSMDHHYEFRNLEADNTQSMGFALAGGAKIVFTNCAADNCNSGQSTAFICNNYNVFHDCRARQCSHGFQVGFMCILTGCRAENCRIGFVGQHINSLIDCAALHCSDTGILCTHANVLFCLLIDCPTGIQLTISLGNQLLLNNTIDGYDRSGSVGIELAGVTAIAANNIIERCETGIRSPTDYGNLRINMNNLLNVTAGGTGLENIPVGLNNLIDIPALFKDLAGQDYGIKWRSPARNSGYPAHLSRGARQRGERRAAPGLEHGG